MAACFVLSFCLFFLSGCGYLEAPHDSRPSQDLKETSYDFMVLGDNRPDIGLFVKFLRSLNEFQTPYCFHMGDMIEFSSPLGFLAIREALDESLRSDITFLPIVGNHDVDGADGNTSSTLKIFNFFMGFEDSYQGYQVIEKENNAFIILNTFLPNEENRIGATQLAWLELRLAEISPSKNVFIFMHHPMFPAGAHSPLANREELHTLFTSYDNIVAVFAGHEHVYYHTVQDEIHYYVSGGAGSPLHTNTNGIAIHHMLGVVTSPNFRVDVLDDSGELITIE